MRRGWRPIGSAAPSPERLPALPDHPRDNPITGRTRAWMTRDRPATLQATRGAPALLDLGVNCLRGALDWRARMCHQELRAAAPRGSPFALSVTEPPSSDAEAPGSPCRAAEAARAQQPPAGAPTIRQHRQPRYPGPAPVAARRDGLGRGLAMTKPRSRVRTGIPTAGPLPQVARRQGLGALLDPVVDRPLVNDLVKARPRDRRGRGAGMTRLLAEYWLAAVGRKGGAADRHQYGPWGRGSLLEGWWMGGAVRVPFGALADPGAGAMTTDTSERGLERLTCSVTGHAPATDRADRDGPGLRGRRRSPTTVPVVTAIRALRLRGRPAHGAVPGRGSA